MRRTCITLLILALAVPAFAQPPLNKRDQKKKAAFEAQIEAEEKYEKTITKADAAFKRKEYVDARMLYAEAIQYNPENEQWLISKVNDLDILMARNIARAVDSVDVMTTRTLPGTVRVEEGATSALEQRVLTADPLPLPRDDSADIARGGKKEEPVPAPKVDAPVRKEQPKPEPKEKPEPKKEAGEKVKEDLSHLPEGLTEQTFDFPDHQVLRIVVREGIDTMVYKRVTHRWGGKFYFKDDVSMAERIWLQEVDAFRQKYPSGKTAE